MSYNLDDLDSFRNKLEELIQTIALDENDISSYLDDEESGKTSAIKQTISSIRAVANAKGAQLSFQYAEIISYLALKELFSGNNVIYNLGSTKFPDITVDNYGFEVKTISSGKEILGNSVLQNDPGLKEIYAVTFKGTSVNEIHLSLYEQLIGSIKVDHNPRFGLSTESSFSFHGVFNMSLTEFLALPLEKKSELLKKHLKNNSGDKTWLWYLGERNSEVLDLMLVNNDVSWSSLEKDDVRIKLFAEQIEIFKESRYPELRRWLIQTFECFGPIKDVFTGGGQEDGLPKLFVHFKKLLPLIYNHVKNSDNDLQAWKESAKSLIRSKLNRSQNCNGLSSGQVSNLIDLVENL